MSGHCTAVLARTGETCHRPENHTGYHRGDGGPFGPWVGPDKITPEKRSQEIERLVAETAKARSAEGGSR